MLSGPVHITRISLGDLQRRIALLNERKGSGSYPPQLDVARLTKYVSESVTVGPGEPVPDCLTCGACCDNYSIVPMSMAESEHLNDYMEVTVDSEPGIVIDRLINRDWEAGRCKHLRGEIGRDIGCSVYEKRPGVCRVFEAGSDKCHEIRRMYGLEPQLSQEQVARFMPLTAARKINVITNAVCFVDSVSVSFERSSEEPGAFESKRTIRMKIAAAVDGDIENFTELHEYDPDQETWLQSDVIGMTVDAAKESIKARGRQG